MFIEHINISAPEALLLREKQFFCRVFGLEEGFRPKFSRQGYWLYSGDKALVHLTVSDKHQASTPQDCLDHIAFQMKGLPKLLQTLSELQLGYETDSLPEIGMTQIFFSSPAGVGLEANFIDEALPTV